MECQSLGHNIFGRICFYVYTCQILFTVNGFMSHLETGVRQYISIGVLNNPLQNSIRQNLMFHSYNVVVNVSYLMVLLQCCSYKCSWFMVLLFQRNIVKPQRASKKSQIQFSASLKTLWRELLSYWILQQS